MFPVTASEAAFLEGGIFVYPLLEKNNFTRLEEVREYLRLAIDDVLSMQILSLDDYTNKTGDVFEGDPEMIIGAYCGGLNDGAYFCQYLRNDITQHASSAILNYYQIIDSYSF